MITPWDSPRRGLERRWACQPASCLAPSPDGRVLWVATPEGVLAFSVDTGQAIARLGHQALGLTVTRDDVVTWGEEQMCWRAVEAEWSPERVGPLHGRVVAVARDVPSAALLTHGWACRWDGRTLPLVVPPHALLALDPAGERCLITAATDVASSGWKTLVVSRNGDLHRLEGEAFKSVAAAVWLDDDLLLADMKGVSRHAAQTWERRWRVDGLPTHKMAASRDGRVVVVLDLNGAVATFLRATDGAAMSRWSSEDWAHFGTSTAPPPRPDLRRRSRSLRPRRPTR